MAKAKFKTYEEAEEAQKALKIEAKNSKAALIAYLKQNKLKRNVDYSEDKKHGSKIAAFNRAIEKNMNALETVNAQVQELKPSKSKSSKYEYPEGLTADEKKKFRQKARQDSKPKKEKSAKVKTKAAKEEPAPEKKAVSKKSKKNRSKDRKAND